jgi:hypothetical protein
MLMITLFISGIVIPKLFQSTPIIKIFLKYIEK